MNRPEIELRQLHVFAVLAEELHFGRAALRLGLSQPPLSQQIKRLEALVGQTLLERDTRSVKLTDAGAALLALARKVLEETAHGLEKARQAGRGEAGTLNLGFTATTALEILPRILGRLRQSRPAIQVGLFELLPDALTEALRAERIDAGIAREMIVEDWCELQPIAEESYVAVLPSRHRHAGGDAALRLEMLAADDFILFPQDHTSRNSDQVLGMCRAAGFSPRVTQVAPGWQTAVSFVGAGLGVTILPRCVRSFRLPAVTYREIDTGTCSTISVLRRRADTRKMVGHFLGEAKAAVAPPGPPPS